MNHTQLQQKKTPQEQKPFDPQSARARFTSAEKCSNYLARLVLLPEIERHGFFVCVVALVRTCIHTRVAFVMYPLYTVECTDMYAFVGAALWGGRAVVVAAGRPRAGTAVGLVWFGFGLGRACIPVCVCVDVVCVCVVVNGIVAIKSLPFDMWTTIYRPALWCVPFDLGYWPVLHKHTHTHTPPCSHAHTHTHNTQCL